MVIGNTITGTKYDYFYKSREIPDPETTERIKQIENELATILQKCTKLEILYLWNSEGNCQLGNLEFLRHAKNLKMLSMWDQGELDCTPILQCENLKVLDLRGSCISDIGEIGQLTNLQTLALDDTNIAKAGDIVNLKKLKHLDIRNTPLSKNKKEMALLRKTFPNLDIEQ